MEIADNPEASGGGVRLIAVAYFFGTVISLVLLSAIGIPMPTMPGDASRDQTVILGLVGAFVFALALFPLARGIGGSAAQRLAIMSAFTYGAFAVVNQVQAAVFTDIGGTGLRLFFFAIPCLLAAGAATWMVRPTEGPIGRHTVLQDRPSRAWWWRLFLAFLALPCIEAIAGAVTLPLVQEAILLEPSGVHVPGRAVVMGSLFFKSAMLLTITVPILLSWRRPRLHLTVALGSALFILTGLVGLIQATWWPVFVRLTFSLQVLVTAMAYAAFVVVLLVPKRERTVDGLPVNPGGSSARSGR
jgi:hypothetical protein